jgi:hypothetical protein
MTRKLVVGVGFRGLALVLGGGVLACGDKLVIVGQGLRPKRKAVSRAEPSGRPPGSAAAALSRSSTPRTAPGPPQDLKLTRRPP